MKSSLIGKRISCDGHIGTILYAGNVPPNEGEWLGIDWDDERRGKHDGSYKGVKYFTATCPTSGSFIRPQKANFGMTYCKAVQERYGIESRNDNVCENVKETYYIDIENVSKPIEILGMDKIALLQSQFDLLQIVVLRDIRVNGTSFEENISQFTPNVIELDLSKNLINSWEALSLITGQLPRLKVLVLSENKMLIPANPAALSSSFNTVQELVLNKMSYSWNQILDCAMMCRNVVKLHTANNCISSLQLPDSNILQKLKQLILDQNPVVNWQEVLKLGYLHCLEVLSLNSCQIESIFFPDAQPGSKTELFAKLTELSLNENMCCKWVDVAELNKLSNLSVLLMHHNPICESETPDTVRQVFVAKLATLKILNRTTVEANERRGAEVDYLKKYGKIWLDAKGDSSKLPHNFLQEHPRYQEIGIKYGAVEREELATPTSTLKSKIISVQITSPLLPETSYVTRKLPATMTVQRLKSLIQMLYKVDSYALQLTYTSTTNGNEEEIPLDNDQRELSFFSLGNGDKVIARW